MGATCTVQLQYKSGELYKMAALGAGPIDATFNMIDQITRDITLEAFKIGAITSEEDALGETNVKITLDGIHRWNRSQHFG